MMLRPFFGCLLLTCDLSGALAGAGKDPLLVATRYGPVQGASDGTILSWKGVAFAAPPVGPLRWQPPAPPTAWSEIRTATAYSHDCMQLPFPSDAAPLGTTPSEDCLYANVWKPVRGHKKLPVILWIYGGGFVNGGSSPPTYSGARLASRGALVVSFNYRLGRFGFFAHPALSGAAGGNYGFLDQIAALKWARENVAAFGGDPDNITVIGESAGGMSVHMLLTAPAARGLFQRAVILSGGDAGPSKVDMATAAAKASAFAETRGIAAADPDPAAKLRALDADQLVDGLNLATRAGTVPYAGPATDGQVSVDLAEAYASGNYSKIPVMVGATSADIGGKDGFMIAGARKVAASLSRQNVPVYSYRFSYVAQSLAGADGAPHATDIPFFFDTQRIKYGAATTARDDAVGKIMADYLVRFATTGNPNGKGLPEWPAYDPAADTIMNFATDGIATPQHDPLDTGAR